MLSRALGLKDKPTSIKKKEVPTANLISKLERLKKEKQERETRTKTLKEIKQLERERSPVYRFGNRVLKNIKTPTTQTEERYSKKKSAKPKRIDDKLEKLSDFMSWR